MELSLQRARAGSAVGRTDQTSLQLSTISAAYFVNSASWARHVSRETAQGDGYSAVRSLPLAVRIADETTHARTHALPSSEPALAPLLRLPPDRPARTEEPAIGPNATSDVHGNVWRQLPPAAPPGCARRGGRGRAPAPVRSMRGTTVFHVKPIVRLKGTVHDGYATCGHDGTGPFLP